jgi:hypothetical protein
MKNFIKFSLLIFQVLLISSCRPPQTMFSEGVSQGIAGRVLWYEGDLMPDFDREPVEGQPIQREIHIYEATSQAQAEVIGGYFYINLKTRLIKKEASGEDGTFIVELEPGTYSVFVKEPKGLFASTFDQGGYLNPVIVRSGELVRMLIRVDYEAAY